MGTTSSGSMPRCAGCRYSAGVPLYSAHTSSIEATGTTAVPTSLHY